MRLVPPSFEPVEHDGALCFLHIGNTQALTRCHADTSKKRPDPRCRNQLQPHDAQSYLDQNRLPVCPIHDGHVLPVGYCQAMAGCEHRCSRPVAFKAHENMLCGTHTGAYQESHIMELPTELRDNIFERVLPRSTSAGTSWSTPPLLLVNKTFYVECSRILYDNKHNPCVIKVSTLDYHGCDTGVIVVCEQYFRYCNPSAVYLPHVYYGHMYRNRGLGSSKRMADFCGDAFGPFKHFQIVVADDSALGAHEAPLFLILDLFRRVILALHQWSLRTGQLSSIEIVIKCNVDLTQLAAPPSYEKIWQLSMNIMNVLHTTCAINTENLSWRLEIITVMPQNHRVSQGITSSRQGQMKAFGAWNERFLDRMMRKSNSLNVLCFTTISNVTLSEWNNRCNNLHRIILAIEALSNQSFTSRAINDRALIEAARVAFENRDDMMLSEIGTHVWNRLQTFVEPIANLLNADHMYSPLTSPMGALASSQTGRGDFSWPVPTKNRMIPSGEKKIVDHVYLIINYGVMGAPIYRVRTPQIRHIPGC